MEWISVKDRLPTEFDADENGKVDIAAWNNAEQKYYRSKEHWSASFSVKTFWLPRIKLPEPPKTTT